ncbi:DUF3284 domain-containing protein [Lactobacillus intestinalis]|uniref:DUF3284 domain-containing protein n=1 Tax=Lactobacillus intestinalis TaxID=151781 RepID=UPI003517B60C
MKMNTVKKQFQFSANDFFDYLDKQLTLAIQQARKNDLPVKLASGTTYNQDGIDTKITKYNRGKEYEANFKNDKFNIMINYQTEDVPNGVEITFSEDIKSYDPTAHSKFNNWLYNVQLKHGAKKELSRMANGVHQNMQ